MLNKKLIYFAYEQVRREGKYNMFDPNARILTGLTEEEYIYAINNYDELHKKYNDEFNKVKE